jgi:hypothetical protein
MKLAATLAIASLAATLAVGCGSSSPDESTRSIEKAGASRAPTGAPAQSCDTQAVDAEELRVTVASCGEGRRVMFGWQRSEDCGLIGGASRGSCSVRSYRCLAARTDRGVSVSCARPGRSVAFRAKRG